MSDTPPSVPFTLFETLLVPHGGAAPAHLEDHLARLAASAQALGFASDTATLRARLIAEAAALGTGPQRLRVDLSHDGSVAVRAAPLAGLSPGRVRVRLSDAPLPRGERALLAHKTSLRSAYDASLREAEAAGCFDTLFFNERGELTEGARSNVFVKLDGRWWTPPLACGLLPGTARARLLQQPVFAAERIVGRAELESAQDLLVCNALRGALRAVLA